MRTHSPANPSQNLHNSRAGVSTVNVVPDLCIQPASVEVPISTDERARRADAVA